MISRKRQKYVRGSAKEAVLIIGEPDYVVNLCPERGGPFSDRTQARVWKKLRAQRPLEGAMLSSEVDQYDVPDGPQIVTWLQPQLISLLVQGMFGTEHWATLDLNKVSVKG